jgi:8-oxo-dGTP diphosphatase
MDNTLRNKQGLTEEEFLAAYDASKFERPSVTVDMLIFTVTDEEEGNPTNLPLKTLKILLIKRGDHPCIGQWALPGGFVEMDENLDEAALRELKEETNIDNIYMEQLYTWGDVGRDPRTRIISTSYMALVDSSTLDVKADDDADDAKWFTISCRSYYEQRTETERGHILQRLLKLCLSNEENNLSATIKITRTVEGKLTKVEREIVESKGIAFDHAKIIEYGIERLRCKTVHTDIVFNLMPELFTLAELQRVYEVIIDTQLSEADFRRRIAGMVIETNDYSEVSGHMPLKLFRFYPDWPSVSE